MNIGNAIRTIRKDKFGITQLSFAKDIGITQSYLSQIEKGHKLPSTELLENMSKVIHIPLPIVFWFGVEESDISEDKQVAYRILKPTIDSLINSLI